MNNNTFDKSRPLSWSAISSFEYDKEQWYKKYILKEQQEITAPLTFGKNIADKIEAGTSEDEVPGLLIKLQTKKEHPFKCFFNDIELVGYADAFDDVTFKILDEVKTGKKPWDKKRVDEHGQLTMYCLMNWIMNKVRPEDVKITLHWIPTQENADFTISPVLPVQIYSFSTKRTMNDILQFGMRIKKVRQEMELFCLTHN